MKFFIVALLFFLLVAKHAHSQTTGAASTTGACSPANTGNNNTFNITCGIAGKQGQDLLRILNKILADKLDSTAVLDALDNIQARLDSQSETRGLLQPGNDPDPPPVTNPSSYSYGSSPSFMPPNYPVKSSLNIIVGDNLVSMTGNRCTILSIDGREVLWIERSNSGIMVSGNIFSADGKIMIKLQKNGVAINPNNTFARDLQKNTLTLRNEYDREVFRLKFVNPHFVILSGLFYEEGYGELAVQPDGIRSREKDLFKSNSEYGCNNGVAFDFTQHGITIGGLARR